MMASARRVLAAVLALSWTALSAQPVPGPAVEEVPAYIPFGNLQNARPEDIERSKALGRDIARSLREAFETKRTPEMEQTAREVARRADDIADAALAKDRDQVLKFLGINPGSSTALYYFLSWSMPIEMIRSYMIEAMWTGAAVVFKGVPPGKNLGQFITEDLQQLVYGKSAAANISIDPRLYDAYRVTVVPTIVLTRVRQNFQCQGVNKVPFLYEGRTLSYDSCPELDPSSYIKVSGAVTTAYALQTFVDAGFPEAKVHQQALAKGFQTGKVPGREQVPFAGAWEDAITPAERMAAEQAAGMAMSPGQVGQQSAVGPAAPER